MAIANNYKKKNRARTGPGPNQMGRGGPPTTQQPVTRFVKAGALVTGDFIQQARLGDHCIDTTDGDDWVCTNALTATWSKVGTQT